MNDLQYNVDEDFDAALCYDEYDTNLHKECGCLRCMDCLGLSITDFM